MRLSFTATLLTIVFGATMSACGLYLDYDPIPMGVENLSCISSGTPSIEFAGLEWGVKDGFNGPGPNRWSRRNVCVDALGRLHLRITRGRHGWEAAEVFTKQRFGMGTFEFTVEGRLDSLDRNTVLGLFAYPTPDTGVDGTKEIDIEIARWGALTNGFVNYTVWPADAERPPLTSSIQEQLRGIHSTHRFTRQEDQVSFESFHGTEGIASHRFDAGSVIVNDPDYLFYGAMPVHINFWMFRGNPPVNGQEAEVIISDFRFVSPPGALVTPYSLANAEAED